MSPSWQDDPERFVKPDPFISDRDPGDEDDNRQAPTALQAWALGVVLRTVCGVPPDEEDPC